MLIITRNDSHKLLLARLIPVYINCRINRRFLCQFRFWPQKFNLYFIYNLQFLNFQSCFGVLSRHFQRKN